MFIPRGWSLLALGAVVFAYAFMGQETSGGQNSHLALVKALTRGTATIDETRFEVGDLGVSDKAYFDGHIYSNKAPGIAFLTLPVYLVADAAGMRTEGDPRRLLYPLTLVGAVLPAALLLLIVRSLAERLEPGLGTITAVTLGLGTLVFPWASLLFTHVLSGALLMGAFALLWRERDRQPRLGPLALAGLLAGLAVTVEYASGFVAVALGVYAVARADVLKRALAYGGGVLAGVAPLAWYDWWAFGSPFTLSYTGDPNLTTSLPRLDVATDLLFSRWGLFQATPVLALGAAATVLLYRRGRRAEALVIASSALFFLGLNSGLGLPSGGTAGTRYLLPVVPLLALPIALAYRAWPALTASLAAVSVTAVTAMTATKPIGAWDGGVLARLHDADGSAETLADYLGVTGWYDILPWYAAVVAAIAFTLRATELRRFRRGWPAAGAGLAAWAVVAFVSPPLLLGHRLEPRVADGVVLALAVLAVIVVWVAVRHERGPRARAGASRRAARFPPCAGSWDLPPNGRSSPPGSTSST